MTTHEAGRELDALIAEKVMGWGWYKWRPEMDVSSVSGVRGHRFLKLPEKVEEFVATWRNPPFVLASLSDPVYAGGYSDMPRYSTDIAAAWRVVEKLRDSKDDELRVRFSHEVLGLNLIALRAPQVAEAICRAALAAVTTTAGATP